MNTSAADQPGRLCRRVIACACAASTVAIAASLPAYGALVNRGNGLIYDSDLDITWMQDANYAATQYANTGGAVGTATGEMLWQDALAWAANLTFDGYTDWHLPTAAPINGTSYNQNGYTYTGASGYDFGFNITSPKKQMSHLYYVSLGNLALADAPTHLVPGGGLTKTGPFKNIATYSPYIDGDAAYWSGSADGGSEDHAMIPMFEMGIGYSHRDYYYNPSTGTIYNPRHNAWAVRDGDVALSPAVLTTVPTDTNIPAAPFGGTQVFTPTGQPVGTVDSVIGAVNLVRSGGSPVAVHPGDAIYRGDVFHTGDASNLQLALNDDTVYAVAPNSTLNVSADLTSAPHEDAGGFIDTLQTVFTYASKVVGKHDTGNHPTNADFSVLGIRADAAQYINGNYLNPAAQLQVGSPITLSTVVDVPDDAFTLSFQYIFLTDEGNLNVYLDDQLVGTIIGSTDNLNTFEQASFDITDASILNLGNVKLSFNFDGTHGDKVLIDDIIMIDDATSDWIDLVNGDFTNFDQAWSATGPGSAYLTATISQDGYEQLLNVPEPADFALVVISGMALLGFHAPRRTT